MGALGGCSIWMRPVRRAPKKTGSDCAFSRISRSFPREEKSLPGGGGNLIFETGKAGNKYLLRPERLRSGPEEKEVGGVTLAPIEDY